MNLEHKNFLPGALEERVRGGDSAEPLPLDLSIILSIFRCSITHIYFHYISQSLLRELLLVRKNAAALQEKDFTKLHDKGYLEQNVYAILRSYREEKRYLVLWNLSNSTVVSLDFHMLSIRGQWVFRSTGPSDSSPFKMRNVKNLLSYELAVIELP